MAPRDVAATIQAVSALRSLCHRLPHVPTEAAEARWRRFEALIALPESALAGDVDALLEGWKRWWFEGKMERLVGMAARVPEQLIATNRDLATYVTAAQLALSDPR